MPTNQWSVVNALQYLLLTHFNISYVVNKLSQFTDRPPSKTHWTQCTMVSSYAESLHLDLYGFSDVNWARNHDDHTSHVKHLAIDYYFVCDQVQWGQLKVSHVSTFDQRIWILTCQWFFNEIAQHFTHLNPYHYYHQYWKTFRIGQE